MISLSSITDNRSTDEATDLLITDVHELTDELQTRTHVDIVDYATSYISSDNQLILLLPSGQTPTWYNFLQSVSKLLRRGQLTW